MQSMLTRSVASPRSGLKRRCEFPFAAAEPLPRSCASITPIVVGGETLSQLRLDAFQTSQLAGAQHSDRCVTVACRSGGVRRFIEVHHVSKGWPERRPNRCSGKTLQGVCGRAVDGPPIRSHLQRISPSPYNRLDPKEASLRNAKNKRMRVIVIADRRPLSSLAPRLASLGQVRGTPRLHRP